MRTHLATLVDDFRKHGSDIAIVSYRGNRRITSSYGELAALVDRFADSLNQRNIPTGERVVIWGQNGVEWVAAFFGCVVRGVICVPLDAAGSSDFTRRVIREAAPRLVVGDSALLDQLDSKLAKLSFEDFNSALPPATGSAPDRVCTLTRQPASNPLHLRHHRRTQGRRPYPSQHPCQRRPYRE